MWTICALNLPDGTTAYMSDGNSVIGYRRGPEGSSYRLYVNVQGMLDITDTGHRPGGSGWWQIIFNGKEFWYEGEGAPVITITTDGKFSVSGNGNNISGDLLPFMEVQGPDLLQLQAMKDKKIIPYGKIGQGERPFSDVEHVARQFFQFSPNYSDLGLAIYDWTSPDFCRMALFNIFRYSTVEGQPLSDDDIINGIWTSNWPPLTPQDATFMNSFMMNPANSKQEVEDQYKTVNAQLRIYLDALKRLMVIALYSMPRTSIHSVPKLYSGQVDISNLSMDTWAANFEEYPGNSGPVGSSMGMPIQEALAGFMKPGSTLTLKTFISFSTRDVALTYSNGLIIEVEPVDGAVVWQQCSYSTPLSNEENKIEYLFCPGSKWSVVSHRNESIGGKDYMVIKMKDSPRMIE